jgi:hypothetical protein
MIYSLFQLVLFKLAELKPYHHFNYKVHGVLYAKSRDKRGFLIILGLESVSSA